MSVRVRFAPSPTGPLHMGGVRTALFNYLFAKKNHGQMILRIEDTDQTRYVPGAEQYIIDSLKWCGIEFDEGPVQGGTYAPYRQSERKEIYRQYADKLVKEGKAYYAFDTPEEIDVMRKTLEAEKSQTLQYDAITRGRMRNSISLSEEETERLLAEGCPFVIRFKMPDERELHVNDLIRGEVVVNTRTLDDKVLFKSDGMPTYHLANVVDDHLMKISHVIRGEEWLPSLPLHYLLYEALGLTDTMPQFAHLPLILKPDGKGKLSKRDGDRLGFPVFPMEWTSPEGEISSGYRESGYLPGAFINMLALLGWNSGTEQEIFTMDELSAIFTLERVNKSGARFDPDKTRWFNQQYLRSLPGDVLADMVIPELKKLGVDAEKFRVIKVCDLMKERSTFPAELAKESLFFFQAPVTYDEQAVRKKWKPDSAGYVREIRDILQAETEFNAHKLEESVKVYFEPKGIGFGQFMVPLRLLLVGRLSGPGLFDIAEFLGKDETLNRIDRGLLNIEKEA